MSNSEGTTYHVWGVFHERFGSGITGVSVYQSASRDCAEAVLRGMRAVARAKCWSVNYKIVETNIRRD